MKSVSAGSLWAGHWSSPAVASFTYNYIRCVLFQSVSLRTLQAPGLLSAVDLHTWVRGTYILTKSLTDSNGQGPDQHLATITMCL